MKQIALNYFFGKVKSIQPDEINNTEAKWIDKCSFGATTYWEMFQGETHSYDVNSHYSNVMSKKMNSFPIREGEYKIISEIPDKEEFGIYRCKITNDKPVKFFRFNEENYYTHLLTFG